MTTLDELNIQNKSLRVRVLLAALKVVVHELCMHLAMHYNIDLKQAEQNPIVAYGYNIIKMIEEQENENTQHSV